MDKKGDNPTKTKGRIIVSNSFYCLQGVVPSLNSLFGFAGGASTFRTTGPSTNQAFKDEYVEKMVHATVFPSCLGNSDIFSILTWFLLSTSN